MKMKNSITVNLSQIKKKITDDQRTHSSEI